MIPGSLRQCEPISHTHPQRQTRARGPSEVRPRREISPELFFLSFLVDRISETLSCLPQSQREKRATPVNQSDRRKKQKRRIRDQKKAKKNCGWFLSVFKASSRWKNLTIRIRCNQELQFQKIYKKVNNERKTWIYIEKKTTK